MGAFGSIFTVTGTIATTLRSEAAGFPEARCCAQIPEIV